MMRFFGLGFTGIMTMPVPAFWALFEQIPNLQAEESLRFMSAVSGSVWGGEYAEKLQDQLDVDDNQELDHEGLMRLKRLLNRG